MSVPNKMDTLPCGCHMGVDEELSTFYYEPCSLSCQYYLYMLEASAREGTETTVLDARTSVPKLDGEPVLALKMLPCPECGELIGCKWDFALGRAEPVTGCSQHSRHLR